MPDKIIAATLKLDSDPAVASVKSFKTELREANENLLLISKNFGPTSDEAIAAAKKVGQLKNEIGDAKKLSDAFNTDGSAGLQAFGGAVRSLTGGFSALTGILALTGNQSKDVEQAILKVQAAMAISEGVNSIVDASKQFKNLGAVIQSTAAYQKVLAISTSLTSKAFAAMGFAVEGTSVAFKVLRTAIITTGIGALVVAIGFLIDKISTWQSATEEQIAKQKELNKQLQDSSDIIYNNQLQAYDRQQKLEEGRAKLAGKSEEDLFQIQQKYDNLRLGAKKAHYIEQGRLDGDTLKKNKDDIDNFQTDIIAKQLAFQLQQKKLKEQSRKQNTSDSIKDNEEETKKTLAALEYADKIIAGAVYNSDQKKTQEERDRIQAEADEDYTTKTIAADKLQKGLTMIVGISEEERTMIAKEHADKRKEIGDLEFEGKLKLLSATSQALQAASDFAGTQTAAGKVLAIASTAINTYSAIAGQLRAFSGVPIPGYAIAQAIATGIFGLAQVKRIIAVKVPKSSGGGSVPSLSASAGAPLAPSAPQVQTTALDANSISQINNAANPVQAYVVESQGADSAERIIRLNRAARLGG
jgi:hypothetical protein